MCDVFDDNSPPSYVVNQPIVMNAPSQPLPMMQQPEPKEIQPVVVVSTKNHYRQVITLITFHAQSNLITLIMTIDWFE